MPALRPRFRVRTSFGEGNRSRHPNNAVFHLDDLWLGTHCPQKWQDKRLASEAGFGGKSLHVAFSPH